MPGRVFLWSLVSALAGFLFGFDTVVISGAEKTIQALWDLSPALHGLAMGAALWGTVLGAVLGGWPTDRLGRKRTLLLIGGLFVVGSVWSAVADGVYSFMAARFLGGVGIGVSTVAAPLYIAEIAPPDRRGRLAGMFQFNIVSGILVAFLSNYLLAGLGEGAWRWMLGVMAVPSVVYTAACLAIPESPRWLIARRGDRAAGAAVLRLVYPTATPAEIDAKVSEIAAQPGESSGGGFWTRRLRTPILLAFLIAFFNQLSGINAVLYFAPRIFGLTGSENALAQSVGIGVTNLVFTFVGLYLIDRLGRRTLLVVGSVGYILSLGLCAAAFFHWAPPFRAAAAAVDVKAAAAALADANPARAEQAARQLDAAKAALTAASADPSAGVAPVRFSPGASPADAARVADAALREASAAAGSGGLLVLVCVFAFIAAHAVGQGAVIWVFISEIFPTRHRASGQALGSATHWVFAALLTTVFPVMIAALAPGTVFAFFCGMMVLQLLWVRLMVVETKGVPLEEMERKLGTDP
ncbi:MAG: MFS transporter [Isosphaera sp.]|nr:MFS transporter [Isosphaera sp.]